ncbi:unannotated protein [freshwater metagenome]|uniref:Unannotated protein n=1 Tax=freshwater metagenome TaxID=449393 RepID=A0A6J7GYZ6_9ZZZZ
MRSKRTFRVFRKRLVRFLWARETPSCRWEAVYLAHGHSPPPWRARKREERASSGRHQRVPRRWRPPTLVGLWSGCGSGAAGRSGGQRGAPRTHCPYFPWPSFFAPAKTPYFRTHTFLALGRRARCIHSSSACRRSHHVAYGIFKSRRECRFCERTPRLTFACCRARNFTRRVSRDRRASEATRVGKCGTFLFLVSCKAGPGTTRRNRSECVNSSRSKPLNR